MAMTPLGGSADEDAPIMDINTTPLIDVMLVLLVMLIITIPIQLHAVDLRLPVAKAAGPTPSPATVSRARRVCRLGARHALTSTAQLPHRR